MANVEELVTRAGKTGLYTEDELTAFRAALGPGAKPEEKEKALDGLIAKLETAADKARTAAQPATTANPATANPATNPTAATPAPVIQTVDEWLATAPPLVQGVVRKAMTAEAAAHDAILATVRTAAIAAGYTDVELTAMSTDDLQRLAKLSNVTTPKMDYSGLGLVTHGTVPVEGRAAVTRPADAWEDEIGGGKNKGKSAGTN